MIVMLTVRRVAKGRPPTWASSPRQRTDSSWLFSPADLRTSLNPTEERDNGWWNVLPSHWLGSQRLQSRGNKKRSSQNSSSLASVSTGDFFPHFLIKQSKDWGKRVLVLDWLNMVCQVTIFVEHFLVYKCLQAIKIFNYYWRLRSFPRLFQAR